MGEPQGGELGMRKALSLRVGQKGFAFKGMQNEWDAGGIEAGGLQEAINVRFVGGRVVDRGGVEAYGDVVDGEIIGLYDDREDYVEPGGDYDDEFGGVPTETVWFITTDPGVGYGAGYWNGTAAVLVEQEAAKTFLTLTQIGPGNGMFISSGASVYSLTAVAIAFLDVGEADLVGRGCAYDPTTGNLWFADGGGSVVIFDGVSVFGPETAAAEAIIMLMTFGGEVYVLTGSALIGRNAGAWDASYAMPDLGVSAGDVHALSWFVRGSTLWFAVQGWTDYARGNFHILTFDGASISIDHTVTDVYGGALGRVSGLEPLYYAFMDPATSEIHIGKYTGGVYDDDWCVGDGSTYGYPTELVAHSDGYFLLATSGGYLLKSGVDPTDFSSYTVVGTGLGSEGIFWTWQERDAS